MADTIKESLKNLRKSYQHEKAGSERYFVAGGNAIAPKHTALKTLIGTTNSANGQYDFSKAGNHDNITHVAGSLAWANLNPAPNSFTANAAQLNDGIGGAQQKAVNVINGSGNTHSTLSVSGVTEDIVSNNHIIARIRQEIGAGANDARILELIGVMQNPNNNANPTVPEAKAILDSIKTNLANVLNNQIITPVVSELDVKIAQLNNLQHKENSAVKRDVAELERIKKEVKSADFTTVAGSEDDISKFNKSFDTLASVHTKMGTYNTPVQNIDTAITAITRYDGLLKRGNYTERDIDEAYNKIYAQCLQMPRNEGYLDELIESKDKYFQQRTNIENATKAITKFSDISTKTPEYAISAGIFGVLGITLTGVIGYWLKEGFKTPAVNGTDAITRTIPGTTVSDPINHTTTSTASYTVTDQAATQPTLEQGPTGAENAFIALVCIAILALTIYIAARYIIRSNEDGKLDTDSKKLSKINAIDFNKEYSQITTDANDITEVGMDIEKRLANRDRESVLKELFSL